MHIHGIQKNSIDKSICRADTETQVQRTDTGHSRKGRMERTERVALTYVHQQASRVAQLVKNPPAVQGTWVQSLGWEDPLEEGMATHSSSLAWRIPMDRGACWATVCGVAKSRTRLSDEAHVYTTMCKIAGRKLLYSTGSSARCSVMTQMGRMGGGVGGKLKSERINVYMYVIHMVIQQKLTHCKAIIPQ